MITKETVPINKHKMRLRVSDKTKALIDIAFEAGKWAGQVELEEHYDCEQYSAVMPEVFSSKKTNLPADIASSGRTVRVNLRSQVWRDGVRKTCAEKINNLKNMIDRPKRKPLPDGTLPLTESEKSELSEMMGYENISEIFYDNKLHFKCFDKGWRIIIDVKAILWLANLFDLEV